MQVIEKVIIFIIVPVIVVWLISVMPPVEIQNKEQIIVGIESLGIMLHSINSFFPVNVFFQCLLLWVLLFNIEFFMKLGMWVIRKLPLGIS